MSRKDYQLIADTFRQFLEKNAGREDYRIAAGLLIRRFAEAFGQDNPRFDYNKFVDACLGKLTVTRRPRSSSGRSGCKP